MIAGFRVPWAAATVLSVLLAGSTSVFSYLTAMSMHGAKCAGRASLEGYRSEALDLLALPLFSVLIAVVIASSRNNKLVSDTLANFDLVVINIFSVKITHGALLIYVSLLMFNVFLGIMTGISVVRYNAISNYCI